ncbi:efflux RND transporter periplasmic adaptor subunit [Crenobacter intestini]|uniref:Efflux RND transporter periplasmic adaptor subunit n=1 Tax=Crenobacter intestini TaxID=2563443 RepID=A0A4T0V3M0_9NEIS|nr:efflux RND transporter periplasmic adaptor subunit [Crenobacter intestini]TIC86119.1 efflux RND transporter periplasmic adaptor subunit [Crenobacter intestini]
MKHLLSPLALCLALAACQPASDKGARKGPPPTPVTTETARLADMARVARAWAEVEPVVAPEVAAESSGRVLKVLVDAGQRVAAGQLLAEVDPGSARDAQLGAEADAARVGALLAEQRSTVKRNRALMEQGFISPAALEASTAQLSALEKQLSAAEALARSKGRDSARTQIRAPMAGVVEAREVNPGDYVTPGKTAFLLNADGGRRVRLALGGADGDALAVGMPVRLSAHGKTLTVRIDEVRAGLDTASRARVAWAMLPADAPWRVGEALDAEIELERRQALSVPAAAVVERPGGKVVYRVEGGQAAERKVTAGAEANGRVELLAGVQAGERIAVDGAGFLSDGAKVSEGQGGKGGVGGKGQAGTGKGAGA